MPEIWNTGSFNVDRYASNADAAAGETATVLDTAAHGKGAEKLLIVSAWPFPRLHHRSSLIQHSALRNSWSRATRQGSSNAC